MKKIAIAAVFTAFVATPALAENAYIGVNAGQNKMDITGSKASTAYGLFAGYLFNEYIAAELAYTNFGSFDTDSTTPVTIKGTAASLAAVGSLPLGRDFSLYAKLGYASTSIDVASVSQTNLTLPTALARNTTQPKALASVWAMTVTG